jgi:RNA polymerase sigma-70 factor, ECF subfamily
MLSVQRGDKKAFEVLFSRYKAPIWSFLNRYGRDHEATSELYQEVFLNVWKGANTYKAGQKVRPWLYRIANNSARDRYRKSTRTVETQPFEDFHPDQIVDPIGSVDLERAIAALPDTLRSAFILGTIEGLNHQEVAAALDISPANARARISRARVALRQRLIEEQNA